MGAAVSFPVDFSVDHKSTRVNVVGIPRSAGGSGAATPPKRVKAFPLRRFFPGNGSLLAERPASSVTLMREPRTKSGNPTTPRSSLRRENAGRMS
jgi:hypothetical protein